jgi:hypothetical protein
MAIASSSGSFLERSADLIDYNAAYTVMAWFNHVNASRGYHSIFFITGNNKNNEDGLYIDDFSSGFYLESKTNGVKSEFADYSASYGWNHVAIRRNSNTSLDMIINGVPRVTLTPNVSARVAATRLEVAYDFPHALCNLFVYDAALTSNQILDQMSFAYPRRTANLREWLPLESGSARNVDFSGNGRDYTEVGTITNADGLLLTRPSLLIPRRAVAPPYFASPLMLLAC